MAGATPVGPRVRLDRIRILLYGKKQRAPVPLTCGLALMLYPYFVTNAYLLVAIGVVLCAVPYFLRD